MTGAEFVHELAGCTPVPLAGYLKGLGVLRLVAEQADPGARGCWRNECFHLTTRLSEEALTAFFLNDYQPSPIVAPWNSGSGFFDGDNRDGFTPLAESPAPRFVPMRRAIALCAEAVAARPADDTKEAFVARLRASLPDDALAWIDAALALAPDRLLFPPLLGTGGNDGRLDFTNNFMRRLVKNGTPFGLFDAQTGAARPDAARLLPSALFGLPVDGLSDAAVGQFAPGAAGGPNATAGFEGAPVLNPWDFVLTIEGALLFAGALTRRNEGARATGASFPFTVAAVGAGWGGVGVEDEADARAEFWAPLWSQPATAAETGRFLSEGRAVLNGRTAGDGLEFARAAAALGVARGVTEFQRYGFVMRAGKAYLATPLGRRAVLDRPSDTASLIANLEAGRWLDRVRRLRGAKESARARNLARRLDDALFALAEAQAGPLEVQAALMAVGALARHLATAPKAWETVQPPPPLSRSWLRLADDESVEFRVAAALAGLGHPWLEPAVAGDDGSRPVPVLPMAAHLAPLDPSRPVTRGAAWFDEKRRPPGTRDGRLEAVWGDGGLVRNLVAVLERRLLDRSGREEGVADPLGFAAGARLSDVLAFIEGGPAFDDARCAALLAGLAWAKPRRLPARGGGVETNPLPLAYAALKPLFTPADRLRAELTVGKRTLRLLREDAVLPVPPGLLARLLRDVGGATRQALLRLHASGIGSPFLDSRPGVAGLAASLAVGGLDPPRLAAALLIPLDDIGLGRVVGRVRLPSADEPDTETDHAA